METRSRRTARVGPAPPLQLRSLEALAPDRYRAFVFPNRIREQRHARGFPKLMALSNRLGEIPYIRLSKIERGEVVARSDELLRIAAALEIAPEALLIDVDAPEFDIAAWAEPFHDPDGCDAQDERNAVLLGAALRLRRSQDRSLTIAALERDYGLPPVILSRLENAQKPLQRWNGVTLASLCRLFGAHSVALLINMLVAQYLRGELDGHIATITAAETRLARTRQRIAELRADLNELAEPARAQDPPADEPTRIDGAAPGDHGDGALQVRGAPLPGGLIDDVPTGLQVDPPRNAGPRAFALRVCRPTLGVGLPASAIVIVDPDRSPVLGGLAAVRTGTAYRLVAVTLDRAGATMGYSVAPDVAVNIDDLAPADVAAVIAAVFA